MKTTKTTLFRSLLCAAAVLAMAGCEPEGAKISSGPVAVAKPEAPAAPPEILAEAVALLGKETQVLAFGDLAKTGQRQFLAANVVPKTPTNNIPGTIVTRAAVAEEANGKWSEVLRCDKHLRNPKGFLALTPIAPVSAWKLQFEQDPQKGLALYFTPLQTAGAQHVLPIGVLWNPETKRYQSLDQSFQNFLLELPSLERAQSR